MQQELLFAWNFLKHPTMLGSFIPCSRFVAARIARQIDFQRARVIVEYGPGIGNLSEVVLARMLPGARLILIEMNEEFSAYLRTRFTGDERVTVVHGAAEDVVEILQRLGVTHADYIFSGIPFSTIPVRTRRRVVEASRRALGDSGQLLVYQYTRAVLPHLRAVFSSVREDFEPLNLPPTVLFYCN